MKTFLQPLQNLAEMEEIQKQAKKNRGILEISGCMESQKAHLMYGLSGLFPCHLVIAADEKSAKELYEDYRFYDKRVYYYPAKDLLFFQADIHGNLLIRQRMQVIRALLEREDEITVVTSIDGCMDYLAPLEKIEKQLMHFRNDSTLDMDKLTAALVHMGYERVGQVEMPGQFSIRGGIIDIYSLTEENPWRIELWGDEIDSIRSFDAQSQRSLENLDDVTIYPAAEQPMEKNGVSFLDYFKETETLFFLDELNHLEENAKAVQEEFQQSCENRKEKGEISLSGDWMCTWEELCHKINDRNCVAMSLLDPKKSNWKISGQFNITVKSMSSYQSSFELLVKDLKQYKKEGYQIVLLSGSRTRAERLAKDLQEEGLNAFYGQDSDRILQPGEIMVAYGHARRGFEYPLIKFAVITETDIFGKEQKKRKKKKEYNGKRIQDFSELSIGDYVVHEKHGLGIYKGIEKVAVDKVAKDYIKIEYRNGSNLYILATQLDALQKYSGAETAKPPKLNRLGGQEWKKTKSRVRGAVQNIARELVELYAVRQEKEGYVCGPDTVWQREFEEMFPYEETEDQLSAIEDTKRDMESHRIMDRLICGDVGYGKTEVAIRAAFKAVMDSKQVVYLVPTTILAQQHYNSFKERMEHYPVEIAMLSRFCTPKEQKRIFDGLKNGTIDIVIGTHKVLSKNIKYKNLGLLIIDEEQRFGVKQKEKIKQLKKDVDVLALSATPIPRTLHMSLAGIRDMSVLEVPPVDRRAIQTYVMEYNEELVREAIERELGRGGQVYYVYNRVNNIDEVAAGLQRLLPNATVEYAHGQMGERQLETIMSGFINKEIDVLVSTTIIETGLDIPNVNTMIIQDAQLFGLSQLYQLRGRVGRSNRTAYAFLMYRRNSILKEEAEKRLKAIREFTDLGSGFKIAMRDLEIRGAGNLLGAEQSGHMESVGYDLYCKMLNEAVLTMKGEQQEVDTFTTSIDLSIDAYIPETYIKSESEKLSWYKRIATIETQEESEDMIEEMTDRYGDTPAPLIRLMDVALLREEAHQAWLLSIEQKGSKILFTMNPRAKVRVEEIDGFLKQYRNKMKIKPEANPVFVFESTGIPKKDLLAKVREIIGGIQKLQDKS